VLSERLKSSSTVCQNKQLYIHEKKNANPYAQPTNLKVHRA
jgi:hypothetical protein